MTFTRLDQTAVGGALPRRFISGISLDPSNPYHAVVSYSGYSAYAAGGHSYDVTYDPATQKITARDISADLGDQPLTSVVYDWRTGASMRAPTGVSWCSPPGATLADHAGMPQVAVYGSLDDSGSSSTPRPTVAGGTSTASTEPGDTSGTTPWPEHPTVLRPRRCWARGADRLAPP